MKTAMIALVGAQPLPNIIPVRHYRPDTVVLIYTTTNSSIERVYKHLSQTLQKDYAIVGIEVVPSHVVSIATTIDHALSQPKLADHDFIFNLTGGTKAMSLATYQVAQQRHAPLLYLESENRKSIAYRYEWNLAGLYMVSPEEISACVKLPDFLDVHLGPGNWREHGAGRQEGGPYEEALAAALRPHVDELLVGVKTMNGQIDLDLVLRLGNQFGIIEAKTGDNGRKLDGIKQLSNAARHLGTFTQQFFVVTVEPNTTHQAVVEASRIQVISLPGYTNQDGLALDDMNELVDRVKAVLT